MQSTRAKAEGEGATTISLGITIMVTTVIEEDILTTSVVKETTKEITKEAQ